MLECIKFVTLWLFPPGLIILLLLAVFAWACYLKMPGRRVLALSIVLLWALSLRLVSDLLCWPLEERYAYPDINGQELAQCDVIVLTGAGAEAGVPDFSGSGAPGPIMGKTMLTGARLQRFTGLPLLVTGGAVFAGDVREADIALRIFKDLGVPEDRLIAENKSRNTAENAHFTMVMLKEQGWNRVALVVAALHAPRAAALFKGQGLDVLVVPAHYRRPAVWEPSLWRDLTPTAGNLDDSVSALREYLALLAMKLGLYGQDVSY